MARSSPNYTSAAGIFYRGGPVVGKVPRGGVGFSFRFKTNSVLRMVREIEGKFQPINGPYMRALEQVNVRMAMVVQAGMAEELRRRVAENGRPQDPAGRSGRDAHKGGALEAALVNEGNRFVNASGFVVGRADYLNSSPAARYWRRIEEGGDAFEARGWFFPPGGQGYAQPGAAPMIRVRSNTGWKTVPDPSRAAGARVRGYGPNWDRNKMDSRFPQSANGITVTIGPFPAYHFSRGGRRAFNRLDVEALYVTALTNAGIKVSPRMVRGWSPALIT